MIKGYRDLRIYQKAYELGLKVHLLTQKYPEYERYEIGSQLRRAALSIPLNIA
jgi:four helix bundle protein